MKDLLSELTQARYQAAGRATDEAQRHIIEALDLLDDALDGRPGPKPSARSIRAYLNNARAEVKCGDSRRAVEALEAALEVIEQTTEGG